MSTPLAWIERYAAADDRERAALRAQFARDPSARAAVLLPRDWRTPEEFRARLILLCLRDQADDTRDELLALKALCDRARELGIDPAPHLRESASMAGDVDHYGMGSWRSLLNRTV
ncbi:hypothetical protein [Dactylosporangium sp. CS-033363]|uniref:hypothetical protein n=1 Tax=Dactylosporangium sp. CS-033363 TaxID=3239935 RepID=UPI003D93F608